MWVFISAAQPTDQGGERVVLLVVVGGTVFELLMYHSFLGSEKATALPQKGWEKAKTLYQKGCEKAKSLSQNRRVKEKLLKICGSISFLNGPLICQFFLTVFHAADQL